MQAEKGGCNFYRNTAISPAKRITMCRIRECSKPICRIHKEREVWADVTMSKL